eukprot:TRINITY_DN10608_c0_g1_i1.p1 TRINITY_DN10608_c0_g1~~TRINITY_DN10608_c0_g1_i1.p1  ORF type:complete len:473 (+),score=114.02 TRINITY_DN10608_c0_g1_i1:156-1574(+)
MIKICIGGEIFKRKAASWDEAKREIDKLANEGSDELKLSAWHASYEDGKDMVEVRSQVDYECMLTMEGPPVLQIRARSMAKTSPGKTTVQIENCIAERMKQLQLQMNMNINQLLRFLLRRLEPHGMSTLYGVPSSVLVNCLLYLPASEIRLMGCVCSRWRKLIRTHGLVQNFLGKHGLYVIGGINHTFNSKSVTLKSVVKCNPMHPCWSTASSMNYERYHCGTAVFNRQVYVFGGRNSRTRLRSTECYDPLSNAWKVLPPMKTVRSAPACAVHKGCIYVFGGFDGEKEYRTVERYDPTVNTWTDSGSIAPMPFEACELGSISLGQHIYIIGGTQGRHSPGEKVLPIVQRFDPDSNEWTVLPSMSTKRMCPAAVAYEGKLWVIGGSDGVGALNTAEYYDPEEEKWHNGASMSTFRSNATATVIQGKIYVTGGFYANEGGPLSSVERYEPDKGWITMDWNMPEKRDACKVLAWE